MKKVLIPTKLEKSAAQILKAKSYNVIQDSERDIVTLVRENQDTEAIIVRSEKITPDIIDMLPKLRLIVRTGAGYDNIDCKYARKKNIDVMNTPGANSNAVAEEVIAMILAAIRFVIPADISTRAGKWDKKKFMGRELTGKTIGIIGLGNIGKLVVKRLSGFEIQFLVYDPLLSEDMAQQLGVKITNIEKIFEEADFITLHVPQTPETKGMVNKNLLSRMKEGAVLVNCARAGIVNEDDLRALKKEKNIIFCTDVYPKDEPGIKSCTDIADIMLPHLGANTYEANDTAARRAAEQIIAYFEKGIDTFVVNKGLPDDLDPKYQELAFILAKVARAYLGENIQPHQIETSFYGNLGKFAKWLLPPIVASFQPDFESYPDASDAESFLKEKGIVYKNREIDERKNYGESMTIDLFEGSKVISKVSIRGTIAEGNLMISRINDFDKLYLEPIGYNLFAEYSDKPGVLGKIASILGQNNINIIDIRAPQNVEKNYALAVVKTNIPVPSELLAKIAKEIEAKKVFVFNN
ncbi:MAG TPA: NAD(P)-dependent oxidoreductase [Victivallales bacterium]|nr:NAD(P)-dependent oxidoreductase [Victivallales bacterium]